MRGFGLLSVEAVVKIFGLSEFTLRFPDVAGGLLYLASIFLLCRLAFGDSAWLLFAVALSTLNPFLLDSCSMASGRGLGLGFWTLGAYFVARWVADRRRVPITAGVALGLAVASDPQQTFAVAALETTFFAGVVLSRLSARDGRGVLRFVIGDALPFCLSSAITAFAFLWSSGQFSFSDQTAQRFLDGVKALTSAVLLYSPKVLALSFLARLGWVLTAMLVAFLGLSTMFIAVRCLRRNSTDRTERLLMLFSATAVVAAALVWLEPRLAHHAWFGARGLTFMLPLLFIAIALLLRRVRAIALSGTALSGLLLALFVFEFQVHSYYGSEWESATRTVVDIIQSRHSNESRENVLIAAPTKLVPVLHGYQRLRDMDWMKQSTDNSIECHADFYYLPEDHFDRLADLGLHEISRDRVAHTVFAEIGPEARSKLAALREAGFSGVPQCNAGVLAETIWIDSNRAGAARHFLRDVADSLEPDRWRWTYERPAMLFHVPKRAGFRFKMDFVIRSECFRGKLPLELTLLVNGKEIGRKRYDSFENQTFEQSVPSEALRADGVALVETTLNKYCIERENGQKLGYIFLRGGFVN